MEDLGDITIEAMDGAAGLKMLQSNVRIDLLVTVVGSMMELGITAYPD